MNTNSLLVTIPFSHYCEKVRWAMDRVRFPYHEEPHLPGFHVIANSLRGKNSTVPLFRTGSTTLQDSTDILQYIDASVPPAMRLYPTDPALRNECGDLEELFDTQLGPAIRNLWFYYVLKNRDFALNVMRLASPWSERTLMPLIFNNVRSKISRKYHVDADEAGHSKLRIDEIYSKVNNRLADGRKFLQGDKFTVADLTFAALSFPVIGPTEIASRIAPLNSTPHELATVINNFRQTTAGKYVLRMYAEERNRIIN